jgi:hypothetical protein
MPDGFPFCVVLHSPIAGVTTSIRIRAKITDYTNQLLQTHVGMRSDTRIGEDNTFLETRVALSIIQAMLPGVGFWRGFACAQRTASVYIE